MNWKIIYKSLKSRDMLARVGAVLGLIVVYRFLAHVPVPIAEPATLKDVIGHAISSNSFGGFLNLLTGGALASFSIMLVGLSPYITASVFTQMLTKAIPSVEEINKDGESGRRRINQWTRILSLPLAILQSIAYIFILRQSIAPQSNVLQDMQLGQWAIAVVAMAASSMLIMWLGEIITEKGLGGGITLLIVVGIISQMPQTCLSLWQAMTTVKGDPFHVFNWFTISGLNNTATWMTMGVVLAIIVILYFLVKINEGQRVLTINYARRVHGNSQYGGVTSILPIKLITAGVIPVIFAVAFLALPAFLGQLMVAGNFHPEIGRNLILWFQRNNSSILDGWAQLIYPATYFILVVIFTYFYTSIVLNTRELAESLQNQGGFIDGVRPGKRTERYLRQVINRLTLFGSIALGIISVLPFLGEHIMINAGMGAAASTLSLGGTGLLIIVTGALECLRQINSRALMVTYDEYR